MGTEARLSIRNLSVSFGGNRALDSFDLDLEPGLIVGLIGANGSGKSTTVKAMTGINPIEQGAAITINGEALDIGTLSPLSSVQAGIRVVHQEAPLVPDLTVAESMAMHFGFPTNRGFIDWRRLRRRTGELLAEFDIDIAPDRLSQTLLAHERALVSLAIALGDSDGEGAVLILDEATATLSTADAERFLARVKEAADRGLAVLMVTHRLPEVRQYCDSVLVLRDGRTVARFDKSDFDEMSAVHAMVGPASKAVRSIDARDTGPTYSNQGLRVANLSVLGLNEVSLEAREGEILGIAGRSGGGASELLRAIGGIDVADAGIVEVNGVPVTVRGPRGAINHRMFYISADRLTEGGVPMLSVADNMVLPKVERYGLAGARMAKDIARMMGVLDVRPRDPSVSFGSLSGGNQQKVLLARWLLLEPRVLLLDDPTVGVDPNTREVVFRTLHELSDAGTTILLRSSEPEQLARLCSRVIVISDGHVVKELSAMSVTTEEISLATYA